MTVDNLTPMLTHPHPRPPDRTRTHRHGQSTGGAAAPDIVGFAFEERIAMLIDREAVDREKKRPTPRLSHPLLPPVETQLLSLAPVAPSSWHSKSNCYD